MTDTAMGPSSSPDGPTDGQYSPNLARRLWDRVDTTNAVVLPLLAFASALIVGVFVIANPP